MLLGALALAALPGCADDEGYVELDPEEAGQGEDGKADGVGAVPDVRCDGMPNAGQAWGFRHRFTSNAIRALGGVRHRGIDLVATTSWTTQVVEGELAYGGLLDKALEDEDVDLFACRAGRWQRIGRARTDDEGRFQLALTGANRLPLGMRDLALSVVGDRTSARFLALVAREDAPLAISDIDGTLTLAENDFNKSIVIGGMEDIGILEGAAAAMQAIRATGAQPVYVSARARLYTDHTRWWLEDRGLPRGPVRLAPYFMLPGGGTGEFKTEVLRTFAGFRLVLGNGNRPTDIEAYESVGIPADRIFVKLPEFADDLAPMLSAGRAIGIEHYDQLRDLAPQL